jgi:lysophospholipase L1-like esterase
VNLETPADVTLLALGDSYTIGEGVTPDQRWPVRLTTLLRTHRIRVTDLKIVAQTGWTTEELSRAITGETLANRYDLVTLLIGVNDQYRGETPDAYRVQFRALLSRAIRLAGLVESRVIVISIPDWGVTPFAASRDASRISAEIDAFNAVNKEEADRVGARYVDVTPVSRRAAQDPSLLASDGLHPSGLMYAAWSRLLLPVMQEALGRSGL